MTAQKRRILKVLTIDSISAVDRPAQEFARAVIMKRADDVEETEMDLEKIASFDTFEAAVAHLEKLHPTRSAAMSEAARRYPSLVKRYNDEGEALTKAAADAKVPREITKAEQNFELAVDEIQKRDGIPRHEAMKRARVEFEGEFEDYQNAPF